MEIQLNEDKPKSPFIKGIHALATFLNVSVSKAQQLKNDNIIPPCFQDGRVVLFLPDKVVEAMGNYSRLKSIKKPKR